MIITKLEQKADKKVRVYLDGEYHFFLYQNEIKKYKLEEGIELSISSYHNIVENIIYNRAKNKAFTILKYRDQTEQELKRKLEQAGYTQEIIYRIINYLLEYHYIDDKRFAAIYVQQKAASKSIKQIRMELMKKGVSRDIIEEVLEGQKEQEDDAIQKIIAKKLNNIEEPTKEQKQKISRYLYQKGYPFDLIQKYLS